MGTGPFAVPAFRWLVQQGHEIALVVTRPIEDAGKRRKSVANPVREYAETLISEQGLGFEIFAPPSVNSADAVEKLNQADADLMFVCDYGQILSNEALAATGMGGINLHGSLLPKYRGAAPINWAVYRGEQETGVTVIHMTPRLDGGPTLSQDALPIGEFETAEQLEPRMAELGVKTVAKAIALLKEWDGNSSIGELQDKTLVTKAPRLQKKQGQVDWAESARQLFNQIRAFQPWPGSFTHWMPNDGKPIRLIVHAAAVDDSSPSPDDSVGTVTGVSDEGIAIATGQGLLVLTRIQPSGKNVMPVADFLRGRKVAIGDRFGEPEN